MKLVKDFTLKNLKECTHTCITLMQQKIHLTIICWVLAMCEARGRYSGERHTPFPQESTIYWGTWWKKSTATTYGVRKWIKFWTSTGTRLPKFCTKIELLHGHHHGEMQRRIWFSSYLCLNHISSRVFVHMPSLPQGSFSLKNQKSGYQNATIHVFTYIYFIKSTNF